MTYLKNKLVDTGKIKEEDEFNSNILKEMLVDKFNSIDFNQVKIDASKFLFKNEDLSYYCRDLFIDMLKRLD